MTEKIFTWRVEASTPWKDRPHARNLSVQVIARTLEEAVQTVKGLHPEAVLHKVMRDRFIEDVFLADSVRMSGKAPGDAFLAEGGHSHLSPNAMAEKYDGCVGDLMRGLSDGIEGS